MYYMKGILYETKVSRRVAFYKVKSVWYTFYFIDLRLWDFCNTYSCSCPLYHSHTASYTIPKRTLKEISLVPETYTISKILNTLQRV